MVTGEAMPGMPHGGMRIMDIIFQAGTVTRTGCRISVPLDTGQGIPTVNGMPPRASAVMDTIRRQMKVNGMPPQALGAMSVVQPPSRANGINPGFQELCMQFGIPTCTRKSFFDGAKCLSLAQSGQSD
jgi:hypothetical protein